MHKQYKIYQFGQFTYILFIYYTQYICLTSLKPSKTIFNNVLTILNLFQFWLVYVIYYN